MGKTNIGQGKQALQMLGGGVAGFVASGSTATYTATTLTDSGASWTASSPTSNYGAASAWTGFVVIAGSGTSAVFGVIVSNTATVLTVDRWYSLTNPTGAAASTPAANAPYAILPLQMPCAVMAISTATSVAATDTSLASEQTTNGLARKFATFAHTFSNASANNTSTLTATWTYTGTGSVVLAAIGVFDALSGGVPLFTSLMSSTASVAVSGDQVTVTDTVTT